jgi:hypothetical protein
MVKKRLCKLAWNLCSYKGIIGANPTTFLIYSNNASVIVARVF